MITFLFLVFGSMHQNLLSNSVTLTAWEPRRVPYEHFFLHLHPAGTIKNSGRCKKDKYCNTRTTHYLYQEKLYVVRITTLLRLCCHTFSNNILLNKVGMLKKLKYLKIKIFMFFFLFLFTFLLCFEIAKLTISQSLIVITKKALRSSVHNIFTNNSQYH